MFIKVQKAVASVSLLKGCIQQEQKMYDFMFIKRNDKRRAFERNKSQPSLQKLTILKVFLPLPLLNHCISALVMPHHVTTIPLCKAAF